MQKDFINNDFTFSVIIIMNQYLIYYVQFWFIHDFLTEFHSEQNTRKLNTRLYKKLFKT